MPLFLAAGTVGDAAPTEVVDAAVAAGFAGVGLRLDPTAVGDRAIAAIRSRLDATGMRLLDVEVVRLNAAHPAGSYRRLVEIAAELGARWVLTVSELDNRGQATDQLTELCEAAHPCGLGVALEFMPFTEVRTLGQALELLAAVGRPNLGVLVDALHLHRSGGDRSQLATIPNGRLAYAQLCDAPNRAPAPGALAEEARHARLMPGDGELDLVGFVAALPAGVPVSVEVQSDELTARLDPVGRARLAARTGARFVD